MNKILQLIIGLGNPGERYLNTRHNIGATFVQYLANKYNSPFKKEAKFKGYLTSITLKTHTLKLFIPDDFMNLSGLPVKLVSTYYKIPAEQLLITHDDIDLLIGQLKCKFSGGHGGHNGLRDIDAHLNSNQYHRLRIGVGHPGHKQDVSNYVLNRPTKSEQIILTESFAQIDTMLPEMIEGHWDKVKNKLHTQKNKLIDN